MKKNNECVVLFVIKYSIPTNSKSHSILAIINKQKEMFRYIIINNNKNLNPKNTLHNTSTKLIQMKIETETTS